MNKTKSSTSTYHFFIYKPFKRWTTSVWIVANMIDHDFQYEHVLRHHHSRINSLVVILHTQKTFSFDTELHSLYYSSSNRLFRYGWRNDHVCERREKFVYHQVGENSLHFFKSSIRFFFQWSNTVFFDVVSLNSKRTELSRHCTLNKWRNWRTHLLTTYHCSKKAWALLSMIRWKAISHSN